MHLHNKFCHSVASGEWRVANFLSRPSRRALPYSAFPTCWGLSTCRLSLGTLASRPISPYLGYTSLYPLCCVPRVATSRISHELSIPVSWVEFTWVGAVSCLVPECSSYFLMNDHVGDSWVREHPHFTGVLCGWAMCIIFPHCIFHIVP